MRFVLEDSENQRYTVTSMGFPTLTVSKIKKGNKFYSEESSVIACSPICDLDSESGLKRYCLTQKELNGEAENPPRKKTFLGQFLADSFTEVEHTLERQRIGEKMYVVHEAASSGQKVTYKSCFPGTIMCWDVTPLSEGEMCFDFNKSVWETDIVKRPHGTLIAVRGSFLVADFRVNACVYHQSGGDEVLIKRFSKTENIFQKFEGKGYVFLEVHGDLQEIPLFPGESVDIFPGHLLAFTEGISLSMVKAGDVRLRNVENNDYVIRLTASSKGGFVYMSSVTHEDFFNGQK